MGSNRAVLLASDQDTSDPRNDLLGRIIHSFIIKIWREEPEKGKTPKWRGHITHVPSNERRHIESLGGIREFVQIYLQRMGMHVDLRWRVKQWLRKHRSS